MTEKLTQHTKIPNWVMSIFLLTLVTFFSAGWVKVDKLENDVLTNKEHLKFRIEQLKKIEKKLDEILLRLRHLESN